MQLADLLDTLDQQLAQLEQLVLNGPSRRVDIYELPVYDKAQNTIPNQVPISYCGGEAGRKLGWSRIKQYSGDPNTNLKVTRKAAGFIWLDCPPQVLAEHCERVNQTKQAIKDYLSSLSSRHVRFNQVHTLRPHAITLQITRKVHYCIEPLTSIRFSWATKTSNVRANTDKALHQAAQILPADAAIEEQAKVKVLAANIAKDRNKSVSFRRRLAPTPVIHLRFAEQPLHLSSKTKQITNATPILIAGDSSSLKSVGQLLPFDNEAEKKISYKAQQVIIKK